MTAPARTRRTRRRPELHLVGGRRRTVLYARVSRANKARQTASVDQQLDVLRQRVDREGWVVVGEPVADRAISASRYADKVRPEWPKVMTLIASGEVDRLALFEYSRATRDRMVHAALFAACEDAGVLINIDGRDYDPNEPSDALFLDIAALLAVNESAAISKRVRRDTKARAKEGKLATGLPYGYVTTYTTGANGRPTSVHNEHPIEGPVVREVVRRLLAREPAETIAKDLTGRGILTRSGRPWRGANLSLMACRPTYARLRVHQGEVLHDDDGQPVKGAWPELVSEADHWALIEMYASPERDKFRSSKAVKYLGTGLYRCGREGCGGRMRLVGPRRPAAPSSYCCAQCHGVSRQTPLIDEWVTDVIVARLSAPGLLDAWNAPDVDTKRQAATEEIGRLTARLSAAEAGFLDAVDGDPVEAARLLAGLRRQTEERIAVLRRRSERPAPAVPAVLAEAAGERARTWWATAPIGRRRAVLDLLATVTILPVGRATRHPDPAETVRIDWRQYG